MTGELIVRIDPDNKDNKELIGSGYYDINKDIEVMEVLNDNGVYKLLIANEQKKFSWISMERVTVSNYTPLREILKQKSKG